MQPASLVRTLGGQTSGLLELGWDFGGFCFEGPVGSWNCCSNSMPQVWPPLVKSVESYINAYPLRTTSLPTTTMPAFRSDPVAIFNAGQLSAEESAHFPTMLSFLSDFLCYE